MEDSRETILELISHGFHVKEIALMYGISERTFKRRLQEIGVSVRAKYSNITDAELEQRVQEISTENNLVGEKITRARLQCQGDTVQRSRTRQAIQNTVGSRPRPPRLARRQYNCRAALSVWHGDGLHTFIDYGIVIHGWVDGHSHAVMSMIANNNNRASTVLKVFLTGVSQYGCPSRVRTDHGGENIEVGRYMIEVRGGNRGSFLTGKSTRNTRIERMWVDVKKDATHPIKLLFKDLKTSGYLDVDDQTDLYCLHMVFIPLLNVILTEMMLTWNMHSMRTVKGSPSPNKQFIRSLVNLRKQGGEFTELLQDIELPVDFTVEDIQRENQVHVPEVDIPELTEKQRERIVRRYCVTSINTSDRLAVARSNYLRARRFLRHCLTTE